MNFSDLFVVVALGSALYAVIVALTGQRDFLRKAVNPHRLTWLIAGVSVLWVGLTLMRLEARGWELNVWGQLLARLVTDEPASARIKVAALALLFSLLLNFLVLWCVIFFPRDPSTFRRPGDRRAAFRYYVKRLKGGLDYGLLALGDGERLEEVIDTRQVAAWCPNLPKVALGEDAPRLRTPAEQLEFWRQLAAGLHAHMAQLDAEIEPARQGRNHGLTFDAEFGGLYFRYLRGPGPQGPGHACLYLFAATLSQQEMSSGRAAQHFQLLLEALHQIDHSVRAR